MSWTREEWTGEAYEQLMAALASAVDENFRVFNNRLIPTDDTALGVRNPVLRQLTAEIAKGNIASFLDLPKGNCHEEILLEGFVLGRYRCGYEEFRQRTRAFSRRLTNWANCDRAGASLKQIERFREPFFQEIPQYLADEGEMVRRFGIVLMMDYYLRDEYIDQVLERIEAVRDRRYYVSMAQAWLLATAWLKYRERIFAFLMTAQLSDETVNRAIQKIRELNRVTAEDKEMLTQWKRG